MDIEDSADEGLGGSPVFIGTNVWMPLSAGLKTLMFADDLLPLLSADAAIYAMLIILLHSRITHTHTHAHTQTHTLQHSKLVCSI